MKKNILKVFIVSLCSSALIGIVLILLGFENFGHIMDNIFATSLIVFIFSILGICCSSIYDNPKYKIFSIIGLLTVLFATIISILIIWGILEICILFCDGNILTNRLLASSILLSCSFSHISLLLLIKNNNGKTIILRNITILLSIILDVMIMLGIWFLVPYDNYKIFYIIIILVGLGTVLIPIINKLEKNENKIEKIDKDAPKNNDKD